MPAAEFVEELHRSLADNSVGTLVQSLLSNDPS